MVSYLEVYNEEINDLLTPGESGQNLRILTEDPHKGAIIDGLVEQVVSNKKVRPCASGGEHSNPA
jgi:hypothetical protein